MIDVFRTSSPFYVTNQTVTYLIINKCVTLSKFLIETLSRISTTNKNILTNKN